MPRPSWISRGTDQQGSQRRLTHPRHPVKSLAASCRQVDIAETGVRVARSSITTAAEPLYMYHFVKTWRHPQNRKYITIVKAIVSEWDTDKCGPSSLFPVTITIVSERFTDNSYHHRMFTGNRLEGPHLSVPHSLTIALTTTLSFYWSRTDPRPQVTLQKMS